MTRRRSAIGIGGGVVAVLLLAGCHRSGSRSPQAGRPTPAVPVTAGSSSTRPVPASAVKLAEEGAALAAVVVARAFTAAICAYDWRDSVPYGQRLDAALERWGTADFVQAHEWSAARTASAAAGLVERRARQSCGLVTGGLDPDTDPDADVVSVRLSVTVIDQAAGSAAWTAQQVFDFQLDQRPGGWLISSGRW